MKRLLIFILFLWPLLFAGSICNVVVGQVSSGSGGGEACSGTYGNTDADAATYRSIAADRLYVTKVTLDCSGDAASINFRCKYSNTNVVFAVYSDSAGAPGSRLWYSGTPIATGDSSTVVTISDTSINYAFTAGTYWIGVVAEGAARMYESASTGGDVKRCANTDSYATPPESFGEPSDSYENDVKVWLEF